MYYILGKAGYANFNSNPRGNEPESYLIEWTSESYTTLTLFELKIREHGTESWHSYEVTPNREGNFLYAGKMNLNGLKLATRYEAVVSAQNEFGWSRHSQVFNFATFGAGKTIMFSHLIILWLAKFSSSSSTFLFIHTILNKTHHKI